MRRGTRRVRPAQPAEAKPPASRADAAEFLSIEPEGCPKCGGALKDYNAVTVGSVADAGLLCHLFVCQGCGRKWFAPPRPR